MTFMNIAEEDSGLERPSVLMRCFELGRQNATVTLRNRKETLMEFKSGPATSCSSAQQMRVSFRPPDKICRPIDLYSQLMHILNNIGGTGH